MYLMPQSVANARLLTRPPALAFLGTYRRRPRSLRFLGQVDPAIQAQYFPNVKSTAGFTQADLTDWQQAVEAGQLPAYYMKTPGDCGTASTGTGVSIPTVVFGAAGAGLLKAGAIPSPASPFLLAAGAAASVVGDVFGIFSGHHSAAVAKEQDDLCQTIPAVNSALQAVESGISEGLLTTQGATQALQNILQAYQTNTSTIMKMSASSCNAACTYYRMLEGIVAQMQENMVANPPPANAGTATAATAGVTSVVASAAASTGLPTWVFYAAGALALWKLL
jgi:hypothetical protein